MQLKITTAVLLTTLIAAGCAATLAPTGSMQNSLANIKAAEEVGAEESRTKAEEGGAQVSSGDNPHAGDRTTSCNPVVVVWRWRVFR